MKITEKIKKLTNQLFAEHRFGDYPWKFSYQPTEGRPRLVKNQGSISVSGQLPTYPSPNPTLTVNGLEEGWVGSCPDTDIDPKPGQNNRRRTKNKKHTRFTWSWTCALHNSIKASFCSLDTSSLYLQHMKHLLLICGASDKSVLIFSVPNHPRSSLIQFYIYGDFFPVH